MLIIKLKKIFLIFNSTFKSVKKCRSEHLKSPRINPLCENHGAVNCPVIFMYVRLVRKISINDLLYAPTTSNLLPETLFDIKYTSAASGQNHVHRLTTRPIVVKPIHFSLRPIFKNKKRIF